MKKILYIGLLFVLLGMTLPASAKQPSVWKPTTPQDYTPISWVKAPGVASFMKAPTSSGYIDYLTFVYLPYNQVKFISTTTAPISWGPALPPFDVTNTSTDITTDTTKTIQDWAIPRIVAEAAKTDNPDVQFFWNVPFFNITASTTDLSLSLKLTNASGTLITSGSRPENDMEKERRMLIIDNQSGIGKISDFDANNFITASSGDQGVEGFAPFILKTDSNSSAAARLFLGIKPNNKELVVYCSQSATPQEASDALLAAGVPVESQLQADGGASATCGYNLPGQYFVAPGRTLPYLMGATPILYRATVTTEGLSVRSGAGAKNKILKKIKKGIQLMIFQEKNGWARISNGQEWVSTQYLKKIKS